MATTIGIPKIPKAAGNVEIALDADGARIATRVPSTSSQKEAMKAPRKEFKIEVLYGVVSGKYLE
jgi:hypothetical protein